MATSSRRSIGFSLDSVLPYISVAGFALAWYGVALWLDDPLLLPKPVAVLTEFWGMAVVGDSLYGHLYATLYRVFGGFAIAVAVGIPLGLLMGMRNWANFLFDPIISFGYPIPKVAFYPVLLVVFGLGSTPKIILVFLETVVPIVIGAYYGVDAVNERLVWSARNFGASEYRIFRDVVFPASLPYVFSGIRTALPIAFIVAIVTEMISSTEGIGYVIAYNAGSFALDKMFVGIFAAGIVGYAFDRGVGVLRDRMLFWAEGVDLDV